MKSITTILIFLSLNVQSQVYHYDPIKKAWVSKDSITWHKPKDAVKHNLSVNAGLNYSKFVGKGDYGNGSLGFAGGITDLIKLKGNWILQPALSYEHKGAHNKKEDWNFGTYSVVLESFVGYRKGCISFLASPYYERVVYARNQRFEGDGFGWGAHAWHFWNLNQIGLTGAIEIDLIGASLHFEYSHGISQVRNELNDYSGKPNYTVWKNRNSVIGARLSIPLSTFK